VTVLVSSGSLGQLKFPLSSVEHLDSEPFSSHVPSHVLLEMSELPGLNAVIHGSLTSAGTSGDSLERVVGVSLSLGTSMGGSSGEADEPLLAVVGVITISLAKSELVLGRPALRNESGLSASGTSSSYRSCVHTSFLADELSFVSTL
jgi:hypothetical protein